ncbi:DUF1554 domain-containing protein [Leptospira levettii]|uniref:DUF1554 domain-containing protein n=1 Tax=Leptospira levettii TaxID=2023178 RepID=UPI001EEA8EEE|nr:DUF1554 domain-containing protein [Leptospira levettii]MCG6147848.1 DUF1554 domain-containing protein [Leptospira levettii]MCW7507902.1 DUF1554 domain-containing protein [Leptospira levettii]MCW7518992.1 DUF1554 domain-containing protein [Leptospira levettii]
MIESKWNLFIFLKKNQIFFSTLLLLSLLSCENETFNNACDTKSKSYFETSILAASIGEKRHPCYPDFTIVNQPGLNVTSQILALTEAGGNVSIGTSSTVQLYLGSEPKENVNVQVIVSNGSYVTPSQTFFTFTKSNWSLSQNLTLTAMNDTIINGTRTVSVRLVPSSNDSSFRLEERMIQIEVSDNDKIIFPTTVGQIGALGGISGADSLCQANVNCPVGKICKAMMGDSSFLLRRASLSANIGDSQIDWVLKPYASYYRLNRTDLIGTTTAASLFTFNLTFAISGTSSTAWTGLNPDWTNNANSCTGWTVSGVSGYGGDTGSNTSSALGFNSFSCGSALVHYCVEQ